MTSSLWVLLYIVTYNGLQPHRISVRSVTANRRTSRDAACTMVIGKEKELPLRPSHVKASQVTSTSAVISWLPSNSNFQHVVCVNNVELRTVKPGVYKHTITGKFNGFILFYHYYVDITKCASVFQIVNPRPSK